MPNGNSSGVQITHQQPKSNHSNQRFHNARKALFCEQIRNVRKHHDHKDVGTQARFDDDSQDHGNGNQTHETIESNLVICVANGYNSDGGDCDAHQDIK